MTRNSTSPKSLPDAELVARFLELFRSYSGAEIHDLVPEVTDNDVSRWRRGKFSTITAKKRRALEKWLELKEVADTAGLPDSEFLALIPELANGALELREAPPRYRAKPATGAIDIFGNFDDVVRHLRGVAPPGQSKARKLAAVEGIERTATALGWTLPDWFFDLRRQIDAGEL